LAYGLSRIDFFGSKENGLLLLRLAHLGSALSLYDFASLRRRYLSLLGAISAVNFGAALHSRPVVFCDALCATIVALC
jgi:hypothetical protein